jgi:hypothetical protein
VASVGKLLQHDPRHVVILNGREEIADIGNGRAHGEVLRMPVFLQPPRIGVLLHGGEARDIASEAEMKQSGRALACPQS